MQKTTPTLSERQKEMLTELTNKQQAELQATLTGNKFPEEVIRELPFDFSGALHSALQLTTPGLQQCPREVYLQLLTQPVEEMSLQVFGFASNCIESKTPAELGLSNSQYANVITGMIEINRVWDELTEQLQGPIKAKYKGLIQRVHENKAILIPNQ